MERRTVALRRRFFFVRRTAWFGSGCNFVWTTLCIALTATDCSGLVVTCLTAVREIPESNPTVSSLCVYHKITETYSLGHRLCTLTAVSRPTQPSTLLRMKKWVLAFTVECRRPHNTNLLSWSKSQQLLFCVVLHSSDELSELLQ